MQNLTQFYCQYCGMQLSQEPHLLQWRREFLPIAHAQQLNLAIDSTGFYRDEFTRGLWAGWVLSHHYCEHRVQRSPR